MTLRYLGRMSLGVAIPLALAANAAISLGIGVSTGELTAQLTGLLKITAAITVKPPSLIATIDAAAKVLASLQVATDGPSVTLQASALVAIMASIRGQLFALNAALNVQFPTGGDLHLYVYEGKAGSLGPELTGATLGGLPGGSANDNAQGLILVTTERATFAKMQVIFKT